MTLAERLNLNFRSLGLGDLAPEGRSEDAILCGAAHAAAEAAFLGIADAGLSETQIENAYCLTAKRLREGIRVTLGRSASRRTQHCIDRTAQQFGIRFFDLVVSCPRGGEA